MITELQAKSAKPKPKPYMIRDDHGLYLRIDPSGRKYWIFRYWENRKEHQLSLGTYPEISLKDARSKCDEIQSSRARGESPKFRSQKAPRNFTEAANEWLNVRMKDKAPGYIKTLIFRLNKYVLPAIGDLPLREITPANILYICRRIEDYGHPETAHRVNMLIGQVFRFAIAAGYTDTDPSIALHGALQPRRTVNYPAFTNPDDIALLMKSIKAYPYAVMRCAMLFSIYTAARPGEIRHAEWSEIKAGTWDIPAEKMKMKRRHIVPLSSQVKNLLEELKPLTGQSKWLFPSPRDNTRCMSENGVRLALRGIGFTKDQIVPHGFRAMFSTIANEHGMNRDVIERQLAHVESNAVRGAYNHAEYMPERIKLMQWWSDYLDGLSE